MELELINKPMDCLRRVVWEVKNEEQTQELKLPENMPDVGRVIGAWGQILIRGKEWRGSSMAVSGGVLVWVLYEPEEAGDLQTLETWIPFSIRWDFPQTKQDCAMCIECLLKAVDARCVSARKVMIRTVVSAAGEALEPVKCDRYSADDIPEDVQILKRNYPVRIGVEAGEKQFTLEEELMLPSNMADIKKILNCTICPKVRETKLVAGKGVFRGAAMVHLVYLGVDGIVYTKDFDLPYSQYSELDKDSSDEAKLSVKMAVTDLETELLPEGKLRLKCGLVGQYVVYDYHVLELVEDAYSLKQEVTARYRPVELWQILDHQVFDEDIEQCFTDARGKSVDVAAFCGHPYIRRGEKGVEAEADGTFQLLYYDEEGKLQAALKNWSETRDLSADYDVGMMVFCRAESADAARADPSGTYVRAALNWEFTTTTQQGLKGVNSLELSDRKQDPKDKPSLILTAVKDASLWELAKHYGSTAEAIRRANGLDAEPERGRILLIPVL